VTQHDHLLAALDDVLDKLEHGDAVVAGEASQRALELFASTPSPGEDERLRPRYEKCLLAIAALQERLVRELNQSATSTRAGRAYAAGGTGE
jgi:hypothetical protein